MGRLIVAVVSIAALAGAWIALLLNTPPREAQPMAAVKADAVIAEYLRHRSEGHLVGRYHH